MVVPERCPTRAAQVTQPSRQGIQGLHQSPARQAQGPSSSHLSGGTALLASPVFARRRQQQACQVGEKQNTIPTHFCDSLSCTGQNGLTGNVIDSILWQSSTSDKIFYIKRALICISSTKVVGKSLNYVKCCITPSVPN